MEPSAYSIENEPLFLVPVEELEAVYLFLLLHVELVQPELGTHRSEEPVSKSMRNDWAGVPIEIVPAHSRSSSSSVRASEPVALFFRAAGTVLNALILAPSGRLPVFFRTLRRLFWYLLEDRWGQYRLIWTVNCLSLNSLVGLDTVQDDLLMVEGTVLVDEGATLLNRNANASDRVNDRAGGCEKRKGDGDERSFAEHCARAGKPSRPRG